MHIAVAVLAHDRLTLRGGGVAKEVLRRQKFYNSIGFTWLIEFNDGRGLDGIAGGNEARFINHSLKPNAGALRDADCGDGVSPGARFVP